jgi:hypothetical protein
LKSASDREAGDRAPISSGRSTRVAVGGEQNISASDVAVLPFDSRRWCQAARVNSHIAVKFQHEASCQSSSVKVKKSAGVVAPALLIRRSRRRNCATACAMACRGMAGSRGLDGTARMFTCVRRPSVSCRGLSESRATGQRCMPPLASSAAMAMPIRWYRYPRNFPVQS